MRRKPSANVQNAPDRGQWSDPFDATAASIAAMWRGVQAESFAFWMLCGYLIVEYVRPQSILPSLDFLPWGKLVLGLALLGMLSDRRFRFVSDPANVLLTLYLGALVISTLFALYPGVSRAHWFDFFGWYLIYFLIVNIVTTERRFVIFLAIFLVASFKLSFFGARTWTLRGFSFTSWGIMGPPGPFQNSGELSVQMLMFAPIAYEYAAYLRHHTSTRNFLLALSMPVTAAMTIIGASSRGAQLALLYQTYRSLLKGRLSIRSLVVCCVVIGLAISLLPEEQFQRFENAGQDTTSQQRLLYWQRGLQMIERYPVLGVGYYNFAPYFDEHFPEDRLFGSAQLPHNIFIQVGTDAGLVGLAAFLALVARNFFCCRSIARIARNQSAASFAPSIARGLTIALWGFLIAGQFVTITYYPFFWINLSLSVALLNIVKHQERADQCMTHPGAGRSLGAIIPRMKAPKNSSTARPDPVGVRPS